MDQHMKMDTIIKEENMDICPSLGTVIIALYVLIDMIIKTVAQMFKKQLLTRLISSCICVVFGIILHYFEPFGEDYQGFTFIPPEEVIAIVVPLYATSLIYNMEFFVYTNAIWKFLILFGLRCVVSVIGIGFLNWFIIHPDWTIMESIIASVVFLPIQPLLVIALLRELARYQNLATVLEAESVGTFMPIFIFTQYLQAIHSWDMQSVGEHCLFLSWKIVGGCIVGFVFAYITSKLINILYCEIYNAIAFLVGITYLSYIASEYILDVSGIITIIFVACQIVNDRQKLSQQVDETIGTFYSLLFSIVDTVILCIYITESIPYIFTYIYLVEIYASLLTYFGLVLIRISCFMVFIHLFQKWEMDIDFDRKTGLILGLSGLQGSFNFLIAFMYLHDPNTMEIGRETISCLVFIYFYSLIANALPMSLFLRLLGFSILSTMRRANMNYSINYVMDARLCMMKTLKSIKYLADAHWNKVRSETDIKFPYSKQDTTSNEPEEELNIFETHSAICPDCYNEIPYDLTENEMNDLCLEAKARILKAKKVSVIKQYESGAIHRNCAQVLLHNIDMMLDSKRMRSKLNVNLKPNACLIWIRYTLDRILQRNKFEPPTHIFNRFCYFLTNHKKYEYAMIVLIIIYESFTMYNVSTRLSDLVFSIHLVFNLGFILHIIMTLLWLKTFRKCVKHAWIILDIFCVTGSLAVLCYMRHIHRKIPYEVIDLFLAFAILRGLFILHFAKSMVPQIVRIIDRKIDMKIHLGFDIAAALDYCCTEIIETLPQIVELKLVRDIYMRDLRFEKNILQKELQRIQQDRPWVAITMKTKQIIRTTLNAMSDGLYELKISGFVDKTEYNYLDQILKQKLKVLRAIRMIPPSSPRVIFNEIPWLVNEPEVTDYLYSNVETLAFEQGAELISEGHTIPGIYVLISGVLKLYYKPQAEQVKATVQTGAIPIVDYLSTVDFETEYECDILSGSTFGEKCFLTQRSYNCTIIAASKVQTYLIRNDYVYDGILKSNNPVMGMECNMWKTCCINLAAAIMLALPVHHSLTQQEIKFKLDRSFMPNLSSYKVFVITDEMSDVLLLEGAAMDYSNHTIFIAPMAIPKNVQKLFVTKSSFLENEAYADTKLLIIPTPHKTISEVMLNEERQAEFIVHPPQDTVLHNVNDLISMKPTVARKVVNPDILSRPSVQFRQSSEIVIQVLDSSEDNDQISLEESGQPTTFFNPSTRPLSPQ